MTRSRRPVTFDESGDPRVPYVATVDGACWQVRINDLTEEPSLYALLVDGQPAEELQAWPAACASRARRPIRRASASPSRLQPQLGLGPLARAAERLREARLEVVSELA